MSSIAVKRTNQAGTTVYSLLVAVSLVHLLNDTMQNSVSALFPILKPSLGLSFAEVGLITFALNVTAAVLQPLIGLYTDARPTPFLLPIGVCFTLVGIVSLALAHHFSLVLLSACCIGIGSAVFHPESSRVAHMGAGARRGLAQSIFQVGGNTGQMLAPLLTALLFVPLGQKGLLWCTFAAGAAIVIQWFVARWYQQRLTLEAPRKHKRSIRATGVAVALSKGRTAFAFSILIVLVFSKYVYLSSMTSFYNFYLIQHNHFTVRHAQYALFVLLFAGAVGTLLGGPMADKFGRRNIIWFSILGTAPFAIILPYANGFWMIVMLACIGLILFSAFSIIVVYAQELVPGKVGMVSGVFFGLAFGLGGIGSAVLGNIADTHGISFVIHVCSYLPLIGLLTMLLPSDKTLHHTCG